MYALQSCGSSRNIFPGSLNTVHTAPRGPLGTCVGLEMRLAGLEIALRSWYAPVAGWIGAETRCGLGASSRRFLLWNSETVSGDDEIRTCGAKFFSAVTWGA